MKTTVIGKIVLTSIKEVSLNIPRKVIFNKKLCILVDYHTDTDMFAIKDYETDEEYLAYAHEMSLYLFQTELKTSNGIIECECNLDKEILLNIENYPINNKIVLLFNPIKQEVSKFRSIDTYKTIELFKLFISLFLLIWSFIGFYSIYFNLKSIVESSFNLKYFWTYGAISNNTGTNPRIIFYGIVIFASIYLLSRIKKIRIDDINLKDLL